MSDQVIHERRAGQCVLRVSQEGSFSYLSADGRTGWRGLAFSAVVNGRQLRPELEDVERDAGEGQLVLALAYPIAGLGERVTLRPLAAPAALSVERVFANGAPAAVEIRQVQTDLPGSQSACIFRCPSRQAAVDAAVAWARRWKPLAAWAVQQFMTDLSDSLRFYNLPQDWWRRVRTNNPLERLIRTLRTRLRPMGCFHDGPATERAIFGQLLRWHKIKLTHNT